MMSGGVQDIIDQQVAGALLQVEAALDDEMNRIDNLNEDDLQKIRANRLKAMQEKAAERQSWAEKGHGSFQKIADQKDFFTVCKNSDKVIVLFTRESNKYGKAMKEHMTLLAQHHMEARFVWVDAENAPFLTDKLNIWMLPTICCMENNKVKEQHNGLNEIDGSGKYTSGMLEYLLHLDGMLDEAPLYDAEVEREREEAEEDSDCDD
eukprot:CAMPEP_0118828070 /NCGR_PEP_ID=MMETSP1162-20130426/16865_1 /TAXON_ID=33656 /ORGANISM="Phaeocystis Sp, Strain CCMP2710" /LENGTH=206 /DNA_ID=CAMNT_0006758999 /DNA_START=48 /DNA_END=668 /DNA_ORIENTATION=-